MIGHLDVPIGRDHVDDARLERRMLADRLDAQRRAAIQDLLEVAGPGRVEVLGDHDRGREVGRERGDERDQRVDATGRGADHDQLCGWLVSLHRFAPPRMG